MKSTVLTTGLALAAGVAAAATTTALEPRLPLWSENPIAILTAGNPMKIARTQVFTPPSIIDGYSGIAALTRQVFISGTFPSAQPVDDYILVDLVGTAVKGVVYEDEAFFDPAYVPSLEPPFDVATGPGGTPSDVSSGDVRVPERPDRTAQDLSSTPRLISEVFFPRSLPGSAVAGEQTDGETDPIAPVPLPLGFATLAMGLMMIGTLGRRRG